jgi:spore coat polysaccharide biosynthesis protein SpsF (cytidylyltransferase family)
MSAITANTKLFVVSGAGRDTAVSELTLSEVFMMAHGMDGHVGDTVIFTSEAEADDCAKRVRLLERGKALMEGLNVNELERFVKALDAENMDKLLKLLEEVLP